METETETKKIIVKDVVKQTILGWKPKHSLEEGLKKTIDYWKGAIHAKSS